MSCTSCSKSKTFKAMMQPLWPFWKTKQLSPEGDRFQGGDATPVQQQLRNVARIAATNSAFAALLEDGTVIAWGCHSHGGDTSKVQGQLSHVQELHATSAAFAAILQDGRIVACGDAKYGGDSSNVHEYLVRRREF